MTVHAIDVSRWQGTINWAAVANSGVRAVWVKVGGADGGYYKDSMADANIAGAMAAGLKVGTYYFASPAVGDGYRQARHALESCGLKRGTLPPALDLEVHNGLSGRQLDVFALEFMAEADRQTGHVTIVYTGREIGVPGTGYFGSDPALTRHPLWIANWGSNTPGTNPPSFQPGVPPAWASTGYSVWQFNSKTMTPGIPDNVTDQDVITDAYWLHITSDVPSEWRMKRILIQGEAAQWRLVDDAFGCLRRQHIDSLELVGILDDAGATDGELTLTDPARIDRFRRIPEVTGPIAEWGIIGIVAKGVESVGTHIDQHAGQTIDAVALGDTLAAHLADHLRE